LTEVAWWTRMLKMLEYNTLEYNTLEKAGMQY
jgi:hypothetical protein